MVMTDCLPFQTCFILPNDVNTIGQERQTVTGTYMPTATAGATIPVRIAISVTAKLQKYYSAVCSLWSRQFLSQPVTFITVKRVTRTTILYSQSVVVQ